MNNKIWVRVGLSFILFSFTQILSHLQSGHLYLRWISGLEDRGPSVISWLDSRAERVCFYHPDSLTIFQTTPTHLLHHPFQHLRITIIHSIPPISFISHLYKSLLHPHPLFYSFIKHSSIYISFWRYLSFLMFMYTAKFKFIFTIIHTIHFTITHTIIHSC